MEIVTCAGFGGSGSSAITDLLKEFNKVDSLGEFEFTLAHELDGISDLEYYLVDSRHRLNCDMAIFRFKNLIKRISGGYQEYIRDFDKISQRYIEELICLSWNGHWHNHEIRYSTFFQFLYFKIPTKVQNIINKYKKSNYEMVPFFKREEMYFSSLSEKEFLQITKKYTSKIIENAVNNNSDCLRYLALDQLVAPNDIERYSRYFNELKVITIDRDPRDLYLLNEIYWKEGWIPSQDIDSFINWFRNTRKVYNKSNECHNCLYIKFEELVYNYEKTIKKIYNFLALSEEEHINKKQYFNPDISIKNTQLWSKKESEIYLEEIKKIEDELNEFCYKY